MEKPHISKQRGAGLFRRVHLRGCFSNPRRPVKTLIRSVLRGSAGRRARHRATRHHDERGPVAKYSRGPQTGLNAANRKELAAGYAAGVPVKELAERFGVHRATVNRVAAQAGLQARRVPLSEQRQAEAARLYAEGMTLREVAAKLGTGKDAVRSAVVAHGGMIRSRGRMSQA